MSSTGIYTSIKTVSRKKREMNRQTRNKARLVLIYKTTLKGPILMRKVLVDWRMETIYADEPKVKNGRVSEAVQRGRCNESEQGLMH